MTSSLRDLKVYTTYPHSCSYLPEQEATTLFVDPRTPMTGSLYSQLSLLGFRRSGSHLYRPNCGSCSACIPARVPASRFSPKRSQRRTLKRNEDVRIRELDSIDSDEAFDLYRRYIEARHHDGDMYPPSRDQYQSFLKRALSSSSCFCNSTFSSVRRASRPLRALSALLSPISWTTACQLYIPSTTRSLATGASAPSRCYGRSNKPGNWGWIIYTWATGSSSVRKWPTRSSSGRWSCTSTATG